MTDYSRENGYICEYDGYPVPEPDLSLSPEERERGRKEAEKHSKEAYESIMKKHQSKHE